MLKIRIQSYLGGSFHGDLYTGYQDIKDISKISDMYMMNGYQQVIDQISSKYVIDFSRIIKNICWIYQNIGQVSVYSGQRVKNLEQSLKKIMFRPNPTGYLGYQSDIKAFCTPDIMSCHPVFSTSCVEAFIELLSQGRVT